VAEAAFVAPYHLLRRMKGNPTAERDLRRLGLIAAVLAHVEEDAHGESSAAALMASTEGDKPVVSDSRFRQILRSDDQDLDELLRELVRVLKQIKGRAPVHRLGEDLWWWNEKTRRDWALDYYERATPEKKAKES
jgi:CRISPR system Cascade subunit CasB